MSDLHANILLVDDQPDNLSTLSMMLSTEGYTIRQAISGEMALKTVQADPPDLILLDIRMPQMDGYEVCRQIKTAAATHNIPIIFLSALDDVTDKMKAFEVGGIDYITKPFQVQEVLARLRTQLMLQHQQQQLTRQNQQLQQAEAKLQQFNQLLEQQVQERTHQLNRALALDSLLKQITDKVRDSLDEKNVLQTVVEELVHALGAEYCSASVYSSTEDDANVTYEYCVSPSSQIGNPVGQQGTSPGLEEGVDLGWQRDPMQPAQLQQPQIQQSTLTCAIVDDRAPLGALRLVKPQEQQFDDLEIRLVRQVANQCAIAIRQARLYEAAQRQVRELEKLNRLKDDFLSTVSHELRTPVANMKVIADLLSMIANKDPKALAQLATAERVDSRVRLYIKMLGEECDRELHLIQDFLDLQHLAAGEQPLELAPVDLLAWLPHLLEPFESRIQAQQQVLTVELPATLPIIQTDLGSLNRVLLELLNNACKYTPPGEQIRLRASLEGAWLHLEISNSGVTIPPEEADLIFDKFYRIPNQDPWKYGGTGLGLALVKHLVEHIGGEIAVQSADHLTQFILKLPVTAQSAALLSSQEIS